MQSWVPAMFIRGASLTSRCGSISRHTRSSVSRRRAIAVKVLERSHYAQILRCNVTFSVYHKINPTFFATPSDYAQFPVGYELVARVETEHVGNVFALTNHIHSDWTENEGVTVVGDSRKRSTSVGDVIVAVADDERVVVDMIGLRRF
jgi:hypothetical protein